MPLTVLLSLPSPIQSPNRPAEAERTTSTINCIDVDQKCRCIGPTGSIDLTEMPLDPTATTPLACQARRPSCRPGRCRSHQLTPRLRAEECSSRAEFGCNQKTEVRRSFLMVPMPPTPFRKSNLFPSTSEQCC